MNRKEFEKGVYWMGAVDWDRRMFDALIPTPEGTSYNSWLMVGRDATVLFDTVDPAKTDVLLDQLADIEKVDYIVTHHAEQDHSGSLPAVMERYPGAIVLCTPKCARMITRMMPLDESRIRTVADGEELDLGDRRLKFMHMPWIHWPETMVTWDEKDGILFSCDLFGSHLATSRLTEPWERIQDGAKRYYAEIMMPFRGKIAGYLDTIQALPVKKICPSHGPMYDDPSMILDAYREWVSGPAMNKVLIPYISMHGSTEKMVATLVSELAALDVEVVPFNMLETDLGHLAAASVDAATIILGSPTLLGGPHPFVASAAGVVGLLRPKTKFVGVIGSYSWGGRMPEQLAAAVSGLKAEVLPPVIAEGHPDRNDLDAIKALAKKIRELHESAGLVAPRV
ncbi:MAG TPA: FprA family A-type flavoprotein [Myxococcota bacterium]|nr:FprA family A-type flavoprotein [Myxococcota bacterium]HNZ03644.1 FprA family A-type flavoprotein [Myxococcota bacterium]HOD07855.1 FprA family A-type flavoprotein [Myxococcota bacterium]HPB50794.1 FprA family A-type flavoprotein [Myxococcota bacterium]HQP96199.1 FprA family A-type flavoprotein [Myxococcota bacterium]